MMPAVEPKFTVPQNRTKNRDQFPLRWKRLCKRGLGQFISYKLMKFELDKSVKYGQFEVLYTQEAGV